MEIVPTNYTVAEYCEAMLRREIRVNREYQRSDKVWPSAARSFLIETILMDYPVPKLSLHQNIDLKSRKTFREIIDGQQRSQAIIDYYNDELRLSRSGDNKNVAGKVYSQLDDEYKNRFLSYRLSADLFVSATPDEIREVFRRINSYNVPLNPEEQRHAQYQGPFKWFIYRLSKDNDQHLANMGVFSQKDFIRMADTKLYSEIVSAFLYGVTTTNTRSLNRLYYDFNTTFPYEDVFQERIRQSVETILTIPEIHRSPLMRPYNFYSLVIAIAHMEDPLDTLRSVYDPSIDYHFDRQRAATNLTILIASLSEQDLNDKFADFIAANQSKTNVAQQRKVRIRWMCTALEHDTI